MRRRQLSRLFLIAECGLQSSKGVDSKSKIFGAKFSRRLAVIKNRLTKTKNKPPPSFIQLRAAAVCPLGSLQVSA